MKFRYSVNAMTKWVKAKCSAKYSVLPSVKFPTKLRGFADNVFPKIRDYYGSGWVGPGLTRIFFRSSQNSPKPVLIFWSRYHVCKKKLLKVVGYYDLSVLSMSVMGFQKKKFRWGVGGWVFDLYPIFFLICFNFAKPLSLTGFIDCKHSEPEQQ